MGNLHDFAVLEAPRTSDMRSGNMLQMRAQHARCAFKRARLGMECPPGILYVFSTLTKRKRKRHPADWNSTAARK